MLKINLLRTGPATMTILVATLIMAVIAILATSGSEPLSADNHLGHPGDRAALIDLYDSTSGWNWNTQTAWTHPQAHLELWHGVTVNERGRVTELRLSGNNLKGTLPDSLNRLAKLEVLDLSENGITGPLPGLLGSLNPDQSHPEWRSLPHELRDLNLSGNQISGELTTYIGNLGKLERLSLNRNNFSGPMPSKLGNLRELRILGLARNGFEGEIPALAAGSTKLERFHAHDNKLYGTVTSSMKLLRNMRSFNLNNNALCSPRDEEYQQWVAGLERYLVDETGCTSPDREHLIAFYNAMDGANWINNENWLSEKPAATWQGVVMSGEARVTGLGLPNNGLSGPIPEVIASMDQIEAVDLSGNRLTGDASALMGLPNLGQAILNRNPGLEGELPGGFSQMENVWYMAVRETGMCVADTMLGWWYGLMFNDGSPCIVDDDRAVLTAIYNAMGGPDWNRADNWNTDASLGNWAGVTLWTNGRVKRLVLRDNNITGPLPEQISQLTRLTLLDLGDNEITGPLPKSLNELDWLQRLILDNNRISGDIPDELAEIGFEGERREDGQTNGLRQLDLSDNELTGSLPDGFGSQWEMTVMELDGNEGMSGALPTSLVHLDSLRRLTFKNTGLCGPNNEGSKNGTQESGSAPAARAARTSPRAEAANAGQGQRGSKQRNTSKKDGPQQGARPEQETPRREIRPHSDKRSGRIPVYGNKRLVAYKLATTNLSQM